MEQGSLKAGLREVDIDKTSTPEVSMAQICSTQGNIALESDPAYIGATEIEIMQIQPTMRSAVQPHPAQIGQQVRVLFSPGVPGRARWQQHFR